ncbi:formylglycine-generating enzyme family protein [Ornithinimicrobium cavernae]|uniref:formylglycine-generating enzyme family protein n=1 Tax=Ornithinimicrobium cavernae TaxID=2666047 RepID=UPI000D69DEEC|nr:formylglycine-generating enzyme family protein [Ornithinimicrobium cavernae]
MNEACCSPPRQTGSPVAPPSLVSGGVAWSTCDGVAGSTGDGEPPADLQWLPGGSFLMGCEGPRARPEDAEGPVRSVQVGDFGIAATCVTNEQFARFVDRTGYVTDAERAGWSFVFHLLLHPGARGYVLDALVPGAPWWLAVGGASWACPAGPGSSTAAVPDHPVVHVSLADARAYCAWSGTRLPEEAEWEYAARGGLEQRDYPWGDVLLPEGRHRCNIWQGSFPTVNREDDGWLGTAPVRSFPPNGFGLHNVVGNVWEWCATPWTEPEREMSSSDAPPAPEAEWVIRGGSYLCHESYCNRYRVSARSRSTTHSSTGNTGFRVAARQSTGS